jgi:hypothetical protein
MEIIPANYLKGTVQRDFLSPIFSLIESSQAPLRRVVTLRIILAGSHRLLALSAQTLACRSIRRVNTPRIDYYGESLLPASFTAGSHC